MTTLMNLLTFSLLLIATTTFADGGATPNLTEKEAILRTKAVRDVQYALKLDLETNPQTFQGQETVTFQMGKAVDGLFLDFLDGKISSLTINQHAVSDAQVEKHRIALPKKMLVAGTNSVEITYTQRYSKNGTGLYRFQDLEDNSVYLYTQFEAFDANQMFPSFDQPDLKATFQLTVTAPVAWQVISTAKESKPPVKQNERLEFS